MPYYKVTESAHEWNIWRHVFAKSQRQLKRDLEQEGGAEALTGQTPDKTDGSDFYTDIELEEDQAESAEIAQKLGEAQLKLHQKMMKASIDIWSMQEQDRQGIVAFLYKEVRATFLSMVPDATLEDILLRRATGDQSIGNGYELVCDAIGQAIDTHLDPGDETLLLRCCLAFPHFFNDEPPDKDSLLEEFFTGRKLTPCPIVYANVYADLHLFLEKAWDTFLLQKEEEEEEEEEEEV